MVLNHLLLTILRLFLHYLVGVFYEHAALINNEYAHKYRNNFRLCLCIDDFFVALLFTMS